MLAFDISPEVLTHPFFINNYIQSNQLNCSPKTYSDLSQDFVSNNALDLESGFWLFLFKHKIK